MAESGQTISRWRQWLLPSLLGSLFLLASSVGLAWWSGFGLLPILTLVLVPVGIALQLGLTWVTRTRRKMARIGSVAVWLLPVVWLTWQSYEWQKPEHIFVRITSMQVPDGITDLRARMVAGIEGFGVIRFVAPEAVKRALIEKADLVPAEGMHDKGTEWLSDYASNLAIRIGLSPVGFKQPEAFRSRSERQTGWHDVIWIFDREGSGVAVLFY